MEITANATKAITEMGSGMTLYLQDGDEYVIRPPKWLKEQPQAQATARTYDTAMRIPSPVMAFLGPSAWSIVKALSETRGLQAAVMPDVKRIVSACQGYPERILLKAAVATARNQDGFLIIRKNGS